MDWKKALNETVEAHEQPVNEIFGLFGPGRGHLANPAARQMRATETPAPAAPTPDQFASIKAYSVPEDKKYLVHHAKQMLAFAKAADNEGVESTVDDAHPGYSGEYRYAGNVSNHDLAKSLGASILAAHAGLPKFDDADDNFLHHVDVDDMGKLRAHYVTNDKYMRTKHVQDLE